MSVLSDFLTEGVCDIPKINLKPRERVKNALLAAFLIGRGLPFFDWRGQAPEFLIAGVMPASFIRQ